MEKDVLEEINCDEPHRSQQSMIEIIVSLLNVRKLPDSIFKAGAIMPYC